MRDGGELLHLISRAYSLRTVFLVAHLEKIVAQDGEDGFNCWGIVSAVTPEGTPEHERRARTHSVFEKEGPALTVPRKNATGPDGCLSRVAQGSQ